MSINIAGAAAAYANAAKQIGSSSATSAASQSGGGFADMLQSAIEGAVDTQKKSESLSLNAATAGKADLSSVVTAVNNAEMSLQTVLAVRDKVISAYTEIMHMAV